MTSTYPKYSSRQVLCLDGIWDFCFLGEDLDLNTLDTSGVKTWDRIAVPGAFDACPEYVGRRGTALYQTTIRTTPGRCGRLHFHGVGMWARILVDGDELGTVSLPYSDLWFDVLPSLVAERVLTVIIDNRFDRNRVPLQEQFFDFYAYGGIYRSVEWHEVPELSIDRVFVETIDPHAGTIRAFVRLHGDVPAAVDLDVSVDGGAPQQFPTMPVTSDGVAFLDLRIPDATLWSPSRPILHTLHVSLEGDDTTERFGLRTVTVESGAVLINGEAVKLLGYCRHEAHAQFGPALPLQQLVHDLQLLRRMGCNYVRGSHYPQDQRFLDLCDELGFLVFEEALGWGQTADHFTDPAFCAAQIRQAQLMVHKSRNHPSVIMWGFLNEGASHTVESRPLYESLVSAIREMDSTRPITYASNRPIDDLNFDLVDIVSVNCYPGWYAADREALAPADEIRPRLEAIMCSLRERGHGNKPFIVTEIGAGAIYGWHDPLEAHWSEEYQARCLTEVCEMVCSDARIAGVALWQFCDCRTYGSARALMRPRAFNNKGTLDEYRRPKLAFERVRSIFTGSK